MERLPYQTATKSIQEQKMREEYIDQHTARCYEILPLLPKIGTIYRPSELHQKLRSNLQHRDAHELSRDNTPTIFRFQDAVQWLALCLPGFCIVPALQDIIHIYLDENNQ